MGDQCHKNQLNKSIDLKNLVNMTFSSKTHGAFYARQIQGLDMCEKYDELIALKTKFNRQIGHNRIIGIIKSEQISIDCDKANIAFDNNKCLHRCIFSSYLAHPNLFRCSEFDCSKFEYYDRIAKEVLFWL